MRFLIVTRGKHPVPPSPQLVDAMVAWIEGHTQSGQMEQSWNFAGVRGGGGILNVDSLEELDEVMGSFPFGPFSEVDIYPLTDLRASLGRTRAHFEQMAGG